MTPLDSVALRQLTERMLIHHAGPNADAVALAAAARRAYDELAGVLVPLIGQAGIDTLAARAVHLTQQEYPWLPKTRDPEPAKGSFTPVGAALERQEPALAIEAAAAVLATLTGLLATFVGESLTSRLMRQAWPDNFSGAGAEETRA